MGKKIRIVPVLLLLMLALAGCGRQGKVSEKRYIAALEAFEDYYKDELQDTYEELTARICLDAEGMPVMYVVAADGLEDYDVVYDYMAFVCVKGKVIPVMEFSGFANSMKEGAIGVDLYTDGIISVKQYSESSERNRAGGDTDYRETEWTWYQIRRDKCTEIARRDMREIVGGSIADMRDYEESQGWDDMEVSEADQEWYDEEDEDTEEEQEDEPEEEYSGEIRFILGKKEYAFDLYGDNLKEQDKIYNKVCDKLYAKNARGSKVCQLWWKEELVSNENMPYLFMQSLPLSENMCYDAKSFRRQISDLKKAGSKSNDEFLVWDINEYKKKEYGIINDAYYLVCRDPLLLNETDLITKSTEGVSYHWKLFDQLIHYVILTEDYRIVEQLDFIDDFSLKTMKDHVEWHLSYYLEQHNEEYWKVSQIASDIENEELAKEWFDKAVRDLLKENLKGENSADYLKTYMKYMAKKNEAILDKFISKEMAASAFEYVGKKGSLQGTGFVLAQLGEEDELCLLTDQGILTYDCGNVHTYHFDDSETFYWNEHTKELLFVDRDYNASGPWNENDPWERGLLSWERIDTWLYHFRSVEDGKLVATCDYYMDYDNEEAYIRDWQKGYYPEYVQMDWEECRDSLWQRRCGSTYEKSGMEKEELDRKTLCFSERLDTDTGKKIQSNILLYASVDEACEKFLKSRNSMIEVREAVEEQEQVVDDAVKKDAYIYALKHDPEFAEELVVNQYADSMKYTFLRVGENRELCLVIIIDTGTENAWLVTYKDGKAALGREESFNHNGWYWNEKAGYLYGSGGNTGWYYDLVWTVKDGVEYTVKRGEYAEVYPFVEKLEYNYLLGGNEEPIVDSGYVWFSSVLKEEYKELVKIKEVTQQEYESAILEANQGVTAKQMYSISLGYYDNNSLQFFDTVEEAYEAIQKDPSANCVKKLSLEGSSLEELPPEAASALSEINVEAEVAQIRSWFSETQSHLSEYARGDDNSNGLDYYYSYGENGLAKIVVPKGYGGRDYERDYYYHDGELYFAFVFNGEEEHRLYFSYGLLIRYIDENKNTYDYGHTEAFDDWAKWVAEEADKYY